MPDYKFTRKLDATGRYDINNKLRLDGESKQIHLAKEVKTTFAAKGFKLVCNGTEAKFIFDAALDAADQTTLSNLTGTHTSNA